MSVDAVTLRVVVSRGQSTIVHPVMVSDLNPRPAYSAPALPTILRKYARNTQSQSMLTQNRKLS
jgi:hypothetical protein